MILEEIRTKPRLSHPLKEKVCCPLCGGKVHKTDDTRERNSPFLWFECDRKDCSGWLVQTTSWFQIGIEV